MTLDLVCLTLNIWDLPVWMPKLNSPARLALMPERIAALSPDLICLQESFRIHHREQLLAALPGPYVLAGSRRGRWMLPFLRADRTGGLAVLSRFAFKGQEFREHARPARMRFDERLGRKGFLVSEIATALGAVYVVNVHFYAGRSRRDAGIRQEQLQALLKQLRRKCDKEIPMILAGDFNASPTTHFPSNTQHQLTPEYQAVLDEGFIDTLPTFGADTITYTGRENVYAKLLYEAAQIPSRLDYVFYRPAGGMRITNLEARVVFNNSPSLSDHNGVFCRLRLADQA